MSDTMPGPGWWLASDGKWYSPELRDTSEDRLVTVEGAEGPLGPGWWLASDGKWYPPALHPGAPEPELAAQPGVAARPDVAPEPEGEAEPEVAPEPKIARRGRSERTRRAGRSRTTKATRRAKRARASKATGGGRTPADTRIEIERLEASVLRRYMGFVPDLGPEPEIRPELRVPLPQSALVGAASTGSGYEPSSGDESTSGQGPSGHQTTPTHGSADAHGSTGGHRSTGVDADAVNSAVSRGPRHSRKRRWLG